MVMKSSSEGPVNPSHVRLQTEAGDIVIALSDEAPRSKAAFLSAVDAGELDEIAFWRTVSPANDRGSPTISVIQASPKSYASDATRVPHESTRTTGLLHADGAVSFARMEGQLAFANTFFICVGDQPALNADGGRLADGFAVFGHVVEGMETVHRIHSGATGDEAPHPYVAGQVLAKPVAVLTARREPA